jgi:hypothetical protein
MRRPQERALLDVIGTVVVGLSVAWLTLAGSFWTGPLASDSWLAPVQFAVCLPGIAMLFAAYFTAEKGRPSRAADWAEGASVTFVVWLLLATML